MIAKFDFLVPQCDSGPRRTTAILLRFSLGLLAGLDQPLADPGAECERATARSMDVAVASRCAAAMNASASWALSVPSA